MPQDVKVGNFAKLFDFQGGQILIVAGYLEEEAADGLTIVMNVGALRMAMKLYAEDYDAYAALDVFDQAQADTIAQIMVDNYAAMFSQGLSVVPDNDDDEVDEAGGDEEAGDGDDE